MNSYKAMTEVKEFTADQTFTFANEGDVLGYTVECDPGSTYPLSVQINNSAKLPIAIGGSSRGFGGFLGDMPVTYNDEVKIIFDTADAANKARIIITRLSC